MVFGTFYNGKTSGKQVCSLRVDKSGLVHLDGAIFAPCAWEQLKISPRIGKTARFIHLPEGGRFETDNNDAIDTLIRSRQDKKPMFVAHEWESKLTLIILAATLTFGMAFALLKYGIPFASKEIAFRLPAHFSAMLADQSMEQLDKLYFSKSKLASERQAQLQNLFRHWQPKDSQFSYTLHFRQSERLGANAFALPDGSVVLTDELVALARQDEEILAILLHEMGHVEHRHSLRRALESAGLYAMFSWISGDVEIASTLILALPAIIMNANYSQKHEWEADTYSLEKMQAQGIDPIHFATIMASLETSHKEAAKKTAEKLDKKKGEEQLAENSAQEEPTKAESGTAVVLDFISSHPPTQERIERFVAASRGR